MKKYEHIYHDLLEQIEQGVYVAGAYLPTEQELCEIYDSSRGTVRVAVQMLERDGLIRKIHGHGSLVLDIKRLQVSSNELKKFSSFPRHNGEFSTSLLANKPLVLGEGDFGYAEVGDTPLYLVERVRSVRNERVIFDRDYFLPDVIGGELPPECLTKSVYDYLRSVRALAISYAKKDITVEKPESDIRLSLDLGGDTHVVVTRSLVYLEDGRLFQIHCAFQRADTFRMIDVARYSD